MDHHVPHSHTCRFMWRALRPSLATTVSSLRKKVAKYFFPIVPGGDQHCTTARTFTRQRQGGITNNQAQVWRGLAWAWG